MDTTPVGGTGIVDNIPDISGYENHAEFNGATTFPTMVQTDIGVAVNKLNNVTPGHGYGTISDADSLVCAPAITIEALWRHDTKAEANDLHVIARKRSAGSDSYQLLVDQNGLLFFNADTGTVITTNGATDVVDNEWHHLAATWDGAFNRVYVDGTQDGEDANTGTMNNTADTLEFLGTSRDATAFDAGGTMAYLRIWKTALPPYRIQELAHSPFGAYESTRTYWFLTPTVPVVVVPPASGDQEVGLSGPGKLTISLLLRHLVR